MVSNKALVLAKYPSGFPVPGEDLVVKTTEINLDEASCPDDGLIIKNHYISFDPYQRGRMRPAGAGSYAASFEIGKPITNRAISTVVVSKSDKFKKGDVIVSVDGTGTEEYTLLPSGSTSRSFKLENPYKLDPMVYIGPLGMPGLTAWSSLYEIGKPKSGETIFISAASGAVGQIVGQLAKKEGLKVIGSVGDDAKAKWCTEELGFDACFNYKKEKPYEALKRLAPEGLDIYYENVGGETLEAAITHMKVYGRIIVCGMISQYNVKPEEAYPIRNLAMVIGKRLIMQGFLVGDPNMGPKYGKDFNEKLAQWISDGSIKIKLSVTKGMDNAADGFVGMLQGKNFGKAVLEISPLE
ncbi:NAD(P)-binding protein [Microthyrium microscopicum]|uniref:NAD(P)-binding protein n=1 Tax=Microthyrium microscopicum TaxID=703497 RepID=A0A6A6U6B7_9PEZI|nr:NAD(P)-binding protein [Microthyrium microscopicum]